MAKKSPKNLKSHRFVVQLIDTPRNAAAIDRLHEAAKDILGMVDGPMGCIKRETVVLGKYSTTCPPMHAEGCICVQCEPNMLKSVPSGITVSSNDASTIRAAEVKWNLQADEYNQWGMLGGDKKAKLIAAFISANAEVKHGAKAARHD